MPKITFFLPSDTVRIVVAPGETVLDAATAAAVSLTPRCGGHGSCGLCRVRVDSGRAANTPTDAERQHLGTTNFIVGERLACQLRVGEDDLEIIRE